MTVRYKNTGASFPAYSFDGHILTINGLELDVYALAQHEPAHLVISADAAGKLSVGTGRRYVAELELPAKRFGIEKIGYTDDFGYPALRKAELPYPADEIVLTLWAEKEGV